MIEAEVIGLIFGGLIAVIVAIRKFNIKHIKSKCGCCECEEDMGDDSEDE